MNNNKYTQGIPVYHFIYDLIIFNKIEINNTKNPSKNKVKEYIFEKGILINNTQCHDPLHKIYFNDVVDMSDLNIFFIFKSNLQDSLSDNTESINPAIRNESKPFTINETVENEDDIFLHDEMDSIDEQILKYLNTHLNCSSINDLDKIDPKLAICHLLNLIIANGFDYIKESEYSYNITETIKSKIVNSNIPKELQIQKNQLSFTGVLINLLIQAKLETENNLLTLSKNLISGYFDISIFKFIQEYRKIYNSDTFQYLISPTLNSTISNPAAIENLLKLINQADLHFELEDKYLHYEKSKPFFVSYFDALAHSNSHTKLLFHNSAEYLFTILKNKCQMSVLKSALISFETTPKRYNFTNVNRPNQELSLIAANNGEGIARNVRLFTNSSNILFDTQNIGILKPKEKREIIIKASINYHETFTAEFEIKFEWEDVTGNAHSGISYIKFNTQETFIPWDELKKRNPYSNSIIDSVEKLYGREQIIDELRSNIQSENIESYKLWGQKRVGKSSIVKTLKSTLETEENIIVVYRSLGGLKNTNPELTFNSLGESLCSEIYEELDRKITNFVARDNLRKVAVPQFNGSLLPLENYIKQLKRIVSELKFIFILDEFDRLNDEFFLPGNLGDTLSLSIGKGLNENRFVGFILVGSENMHLLDRQGINYNSYQEKEVDTFNKEREYSSFAQIVKGPVQPFINFLDDSIDKIFFESNGNPYFANLICANIFKISYNFKDTEVDSQLVTQALTTIINSSQKSHFEHYWADGLIDETNIKKERKSDIRRRILVCFGIRANLKENKFPTKLDLSKYFTYPVEYEIEKYEVDNTITEFFNRKIFYETQTNQIRILPPIFESWLCNKGKSLMIEGISDLEALQREMDLEIELEIKDDELNRLRENYPFKTKYLNIDKIRNYLNQYGDATSRRRIFKLLDSIFYIAKNDLVQFFRRERRNIFSKTELHIKENVKTVYREKIELYTFSRYHSENRIILDLFKTLNHIRSQKQVKIIKEDPISWRKNNAEEIIIFEPIIENYGDIQSELFLLLTPDLKNSHISIRLITIVITTKAKADLITATSSISNFKIISHIEVEESKLKPFVTGTELFENSSESNLAYYEVRKLFPNTNKDTLLVLFEDYCPSKSCPILWHQSPQFTPLFHNEFGVIELPGDKEIAENRRDRAYYINKELTQKLNSFLVNYLKEKAAKDGQDDWFRIEYIPNTVLTSVFTKWTQEGQINPKESYFDFIQYKEIIIYSKNSDLKPIFQIGADGFKWLERANYLRRDPAHPEQPAPSAEELIEFEEILKKVVARLK